MSANNNIPTTPSRMADRLPFPQSHNPSPTPTFRSSSATTPPTTTTTSSNPNSTSTSPPSLPPSTSSTGIKPTTAPISLASLLAIHTSAPNPHLAALEQALSERNLLSTQNSQLWKLIEKQRSGYNQLLKELDRVRSERDALRVRVKANGLSGDKILKNSTSSSAMRNESNGSMNGPREILPLVPQRHHSDDVGEPTPRNQHYQLPPPRSQDQQQPCSPQSAHPTKTSPPPFVVPLRSESLPVSSSSSLTTSLPILSSDPQTDRNTRSGTQQQRYTPTTSNGTSSTSNTPSASARSSLSSSSHNDSPTTTLPPPPTLVYPPTSSSPGPAPPLSAQTAGYSPMMQAALAPSLMSTSITSSSASSPSSMPASVYLDPNPPHDRTPLSRESRISLPDEAKRYIASMGESPVPSPKLGGFQAPAQAQEQSQSQFQPGSGHHPHNGQQKVRLSPPKLSAPDMSPMKSIKSLESTGETEYLDLGDADNDGEGSDDEDGEGDEGDVGDEERDEDEGEGDSNSGGSTGGYSTRALEPSVRPLVVPNGRNIAKGRAAAEDFPLPPGFGNVHVPGGQAHMQVQQLQAQQVQMQVNSQVHAQQMHHASYAQSQVQGRPIEQSSIQSHPQPPPSSSSQSRLTKEQDISPPFSQIHGSSETHSSPYLSNPPSSSTSLMTQPVGTAGTTASSSAFRALPLLATDLPYTCISVSQSSIRPNDRGKEVLSFTVEVDPGHGKEPWKVEKLYSDVLGLDQRIRASVGKGVGKKIGNLPEGKLWRDHAPAKVDQRKATLEAYLQTLINLPVKNKDEVIAFFCSDIVRETKKPVYQAGYKEGYLTKRGKSFGGWKTRYFVLQGPVLEYYESRGGTHLGSITITGAQIGRQQRTGDRRELDDEKEYRHAFLIIEAKKGPSGSSARHVLCAESDGDRDDWVDVLVRYVMGTYNDLTAPYGQGSTSLATGTNTATQNAISVGQPRSSTSSITPFDNHNLHSTPNGRKSMKVGMPKEDIIIAKGPAVPISQLAPDATNMKLFQSLQHEEIRASSPSKDLSPTDRKESNGFSDSDHAKRILDKGQPPVAEIPLSSSLPTSSPLDGPTGLVGTRANSELGHYSDLPEQRDGRHGATSPERHRPRERKAFQPTLNTVVSTPNMPSQRDQDSLQDNATISRADFQGKAKISGPLGGTVIPAGYKFGGKDVPAEATPSATDRREKAKSRSFWGFGKNDKQPAVVSHIPRAVFGVTLEESLDVVEIANLPAVVFRCVQYLEAKKADQEEGIYRLSGSSAVIKSLKDRFNTEGDVDLLSSDEYWDPHAIAGLLKSYLRELPASILTRELHLRFLSVIDFVDPQERIKELSHLIASLPIANYSLLRALTAHLILIVQNAGINKMTMRNVGIVFSPTLGIPAGVFSLMLGEFNRVFNVDEGGNDDKGGGDNSSAAEDPIRRNSRQYTDTAADQMLGLSGRSLTAPVEEGHSDADSISVDYESGPESTEDNATAESSTRSSLGAGHHDRAHPDYNIPSTPKASKATHAAATRGLHVAVSNRGNRHSRIMLPVSPRPGHSPHDPSPPVTVSPMHTPK